jgi:hypothetical protein
VSNVAGHYLDEILEDVEHLDHFPVMVEDRAGDFGPIRDSKISHVTANLGASLLVNHHASLRADLWPWAFTGQPEHGLCHRSDPSG